MPKDFYRNKSKEYIHLNGPQPITSKFTNLCTLFMILSIMEVLLGIITIVGLQYYELILSKFYHFKERSHLQSHLFFMDIFAMQVIITYCVGISLNKRVCQDNYTNHISLLLIFWNAYNYLLIFYGYCMCFMLYRGMSGIKSSLAISMLDGMNLYYSDPEWRIILDDLQYHKECCGVADYKDWETIPCMDDRTLEVAGDSADGE